MNKRFSVQDMETGNIIDYFDSISEACKAIERYEAMDKEDGNYTEDFYEVYDELGEY